MPQWNLYRSPLALAIAAGLVAAGVAVALLHWQSQVATQQARLDALSQATAAEAAALLQSWAEDDGDLTFVIGRLHDDRPGVARAAAEVLCQQLLAWQALDSETSSPLVAELAQQLAREPLARGVAGRAAASTVAQRIVAWPFDEQQVDPLAVLADCDQVIRAASGAQSNELMLAADPRAARGDAAMMIARRTSASPGDVEVAPVLPGGALPIEVIELPAEDPPSVPPESSPEEPFSPPGEIYAPLATPLDLLEGKEHPDDRTALQPHDAGTLRPTKLNKPTAATDDEWSLMQQLHNAHTAPAAEAELRRQGHTDNTLALARKLTDADPRVRQQLAELLPQLGDVDPRPWLVQLTRDPHPEVRRTAIAILASGNDASVTRWLQQIRQQETDPRVSEAIDDLLRERR